MLSPPTLVRSNWEPSEDNETGIVLLEADRSAALMLKDCNDGPLRSELGDKSQEMRNFVQFDLRGISPQQLLVGSTRDDCKGLLPTSDLRQHLGEPPTNAPQKHGGRNIEPGTSGDTQ